MKKIALHIAGLDWPSVEKAIGRTLKEEEFYYDSYPLFMEEILLLKEKNIWSSVAEQDYQNRVTKYFSDSGFLKVDIERGIALDYMLRNGISDPLSIHRTFEITPDVLMEFVATE